MYRRLVQFLILVLTFAVGFALATFHARRKAASTPKAVTKPVDAPITFSSDGMVSAFKTYYSSSDGQHLRYGCDEFSSPSEAERSLHEEMAMKYVTSPGGAPTKIGVVERTVTFDAKGSKTGERFVLDSGQILWYEGPRTHRILAPSQKYARRFEDSKVWANEGCWNVAAVWAAFSK